MELVYLWVEDYKNIKNQGFNFSPRFICKYDEDKKQLTINENKKYVHILPDNINISAIAGKNGVGKSNLTKFFSEIQNLTHSDKTNADREKYQKLFKNLEYVIVFLNGPFLWIFHPYLNEIINNTKYKLHYDETIHYHTEFNFAFYNTSSFENYTFKEELAPLYERIIEHEKYEYLIHTIMQSSESNILKNIFKQETVSFEKFVISYLFTIDYLNTFFGWIYNYVENFEKTVHDKDRNYRYKVDKLLSYFDENCIFPRNINDFTKEQKSIIIKLMLAGGLDGFDFAYHGYLDVLAVLFKKESLQDTITNDFYKFLMQKTFFEMASDDLFEDDIFLKLEISEIKNWETYEQNLMTLISNDIVRNNLIINMNTTLLDISNLSSGEKSILLLKLVINKLIDEYDRLKPDNKSLVILLDEPETYLHPELQKKLISDLINVFANIDFEIHFIITTHSSFLLSDLNKNSIVFLDKVDDYSKEKYPNLNIDGLNKGNCINVSESIDIETFGANIHTLLSHGFFMQDGLMGEFAKGKITEVLNFLNDKEELKTIQKDQIKSIIESIGEDFLRNKLLNLYRKKLSEDEKEKEKQSLKDKIDELTRQYDELDK